MKEALCKEFCSQLLVRQVPDGLAVGTNFIGLDGDPIGFYVVGPNSSNQFFVEDSGATVSILAACGADVALETRGQIFRGLLEQYGVEYDEDSSELKTKALSEDEIPKAALRFVALLLRLQDLTFLTRESAESTFKQEAIRDIKREIGERAIVLVDEVVFPSLIPDVSADVVIRADGRPTVAVFLVRSDARLYEAMMLQMEADLKARVDCKVVALLEQQSVVGKHAFSQALNRVIPLAYRGQEQEAVGRISKEAGFTRRLDS